MKLLCLLLACTACKRVNGVDLDITGPVSRVRFLDEAEGEYTVLRGSEGLLNVSSAIAAQDFVTAGGLSLEEVGRRLSLSGAGGATAGQSLNGVVLQLEHGGVDAASAHSCALLVDHSVWCWGYGAQGQLGLGDQNNRNSPTRVEALGYEVATISLHHHSSFATLLNGSIVAWGWNHGHLLGLGVGDDLVLTPTLIPEAEVWATSGLTAPASAAAASSGGASSSQVEELQAQIAALQAQLLASTSRLDCSVGRHAVIPEGVLSLPNDAFRECDFLETVHLPASLQYISRYAFQNTPSLRNVTFAAGSSLLSIGYNAFENAAALTSITLPEGLTTIGTYAFHLTALTSISIPEGVTTIPYGLFRSCASLTTVTLPSTITSIESEAFSNTPALQQVIVPQGATVDSNAFGGTNTGGWAYASSG